MTPVEELHDADRDLILHPQQVKILRLIANGNSDYDIAGQLGLSLHTVKTHVRRILGRLGARDRTHAALIGVRRGVVDLNSINVPDLNPFGTLGACHPRSTA
ncbi:response regulator transcription factor [Streptomyces sp. NPDC056437]|uniref:response regulator transcription factor n=1 Tax=Streptomyces sp. NPDC056437 TaxID=3345816 RepID=UPI0036CC690F